MYDALTPMATAYIPARDVRAGDTIEYTDAMTGRPARRQVLGLSFSFVWVGGQRLDTVCLAVDPVTGRGPVMEAGDAVAVVTDDEPAGGAAGRDPHPGERSWW